MRYSEFYPIVLKAESVKALIVGGGEVGERKAEGLLRAGIRVKVVSPEVTEKLEMWHKEGLLFLEKREFREDDIEGFNLVFAATNKREINSKVAALAKKKGALVNVADSLEESDFIVPSVFRKGGLVVSVSTGGLSPAVSKLLRKKLEAFIEDELGEYLTFVGSVRKNLMEQMGEEDRRKVLLFLGSDEAYLTYKKKGLEALKDALRRMGVRFEGP